MRTTGLLIFLGLFTTGLAGALPATASAQYGADARIWVDNDRDYFRGGDRLRVRFSTSANSYVAVVHVDPDGYIDFLYPTSPWDDEFVRAGRVHTLDGIGRGNGLLVRGGSGIGYLYVIASPVPLDYSNFRAGRGLGWDWSYAGRQVAGDPFWAMEQLTRLLVPGWGNVPYAVDYYTYYVGGRHAYPSYACANYGGGWGWGYSPAWTSYYGACNRLDRFLGNNPYYFDSRRYRGDRWSYYRDYRDYRDWDPRHGYKEDPRARAGTRVEPRPSDTGARVTPRSAQPVTPSSRPAQRAAPERSSSAPTPAREAPRPTEQPAPARATPRPTERPAPAARPRVEEREPEQPAPARATPRPTERPAPAPRPRVEEREPEPARPAARTRPEPRSAAASSGRSAPAPATRSASPSRASGSSSRGSTTATPSSRRGD